MGMAPIVLPKKFVSPKKFCSAAHVYAEYRARTGRNSWHNAIRELSSGNAPSKSSPPHRNRGLHFLYRVRLKDDGQKNLAGIVQDDSWNAFLSLIGDLFEI